MALNIHFPKKLSEAGILFLVISIAIGSILYANLIANKIEDQEKSQVILWAKAISEKTKVLKLSNDVYKKLAEEERKKVEITSKATQFIISTDNEKLQFFLLDILKLNDQIPIIQTDENNIIIDIKNINNKNIKPGKTLSKASNPEFFKYPPIEVPYLDKKNRIYYRESIIFQKITQVTKESKSQFVDEIKNNSSLLPVILTDKDGSILEYGNIPNEIIRDSSQFNQYVNALKSSMTPIVIDIDPPFKKYLYYKNSNLASYIKWFPIGLYAILAVIFALTYATIKNTRNFEKNQIWVGMSKETAHQLGTPISSLSAWLEVFGEGHLFSESQQNVLDEMKKDVNRLTLIADRFSKIGSKPKLESIPLHEILMTCFDYLKKRASKKVQFTISDIDPTWSVEINRQLFEWVIENVVKNAFDAIPHEGNVSIRASSDSRRINIDVKDSGKGILPKDIEQIFEPGFTTKKRGWGLGLSLCKRIISDYFGGKIYVLWSKQGLGTTIRIELKKN